MKRNGRIMYFVILNDRKKIVRINDMHAAVPSAPPK